MRDGKQAHPDLAEVDAKSTHAGRPGEDLHGGVQQLAMSAKVTEVQWKQSGLG